MIYKTMVENMVYKYKSHCIFLTILHRPRQGFSLDPLGNSQRPTLDPQLHLTFLWDIERPTVFHYHFPKFIRTTLPLISSSKPRFRIWNNFFELLRLRFPGLEIAMMLMNWCWRFLILIKLFVFLPKSN